MTSRMTRRFRAPGASCSPFGRKTPNPGLDRAVRVRVRAESGYGRWESEPHRARTFQVGGPLPGAAPYPWRVRHAGCPAAPGRQSDVSPKPSSRHRSRGRLGEIRAAPVWWRGASKPDRGSMPSRLARAAAAGSRPSPSPPWASCSRTSTGERPRRSSSRSRSTGRLSDLTVVTVSKTEPQEVVFCPHEALFPRNTRYFHPASLPRAQDGHAL